MDSCALFAIPFLGGLVYFLLAPWVLKRALLGRYDRELFTPTYWQSIEEVLPFYRYRRAMLYLGVLGWPRLARRRFPGYDFGPKATPLLRGASWLYWAAAGVTSAIAFYNFVFGLPC